MASSAQDPLDIFARRAEPAGQTDPLAVFAKPRGEDRWVRKGLFLVNGRTGAKVFSPVIQGGLQTVDVPTVTVPTREVVPTQARSAFPEPAKEAAFLKWYRERADRMGLDPNPDNPEHHYDYRRAFEGGAETGYDPTSGEIHWPSAYKLADHPNRYVGIIDTITGKPRPIPGSLPTDQIDIEATPAGGTPTSAYEQAAADSRLGGVAAGPLRFLGLIGGTEEEKRFKQERLLSASYGPWIGLAEAAGAVPEGTRAAVRENYDQALDTYLTSNPEGGVGRAIGLSAGEIGAGLPSPSALAGMGAGRLGSLAARGAPPVAQAAAAAGAGAIEQTAESYLDAKDLPLRERLAAAGMGAGLGVLGGVSAVREARALPEALQTRGAKTLASAMGEVSEAPGGAFPRLPDGIEELASASQRIGQSPEAGSRIPVADILEEQDGATRVLKALSGTGDEVGELRYREEPGGGFRVDSVATGQRGSGVGRELYKAAAERSGPYRGAAALTAEGEGFTARLRETDPQIFPAEPAPAPRLLAAGDTRGAGRRFHGSRGELDLGAANHVGSENSYYGDVGLYTTDAVDVASGYARRGSLYEVKERAPAKLLDMEAPISLETRAVLARIAENDDPVAALAGEALSVNPRNLREFYDLVRDFSHEERIPSYEVQEGIFGPAASAFREQGYDGMRHAGGLRTGTRPHEVAIYFDPEKAVTAERLSGPRPAGERGHLDLSSLSEDLKRWTKRNLASGGRYASAADDFATPEQRAFVKEIPRRIERMEGQYRVALAGKDDILSTADKAVRTVTKTAKQRTQLYADMHLAAIGEKALTDLPEPVRPLVARANDFVRTLSEEGLATGALPEEMRPQIAAQQGGYRHRAYAAFDDPHHFRQVQKDADTWGAAYDFLRKEMVEEPSLRFGSKVTVEGQPAEVVQVGLRGREARKLAAQDPVVQTKIAAHRAALAARQMSQADFLSRFKAEFSAAAQKIRIAHADDVRVRLADGTEKVVQKSELRGGHFGSEKEIDAEITDFMSALADRPQGAEALSVYAGAPSRINSILKERANIPPPLRKLMGEYTDFRVSLERTVHNLAWDIETHKMLQSLAGEGEAAGVFRRPGVPHSQAGLYQPVAGNASESGLGSRSPLAGMLTTPELRKALASEVEQAKIGWWSRLAGWTKAGKVVQNPGGIARNFYSHTITTTANGRSPVNPRLWSEVRRYGADPALRDRAIAEGIIGDGFASREVEDYIRWIEASNNPIAAGYAALSKKFAKAFRWGDDVWRLYNWLGETEDQMAARGLSRPEAEVLAADRVKDTFQTYSRAPEIANRIRKNPLLGSPAATFTIEGVRNVKNIAKYAAQDIREGLATGNPELVKMGSRKVVGLMAASLALYATGKAAQKVAGVTDEQVQALRRQVVPRYHQDSEIVVLSAKPGESVSYIDLSFLNPYNGISKPLIAAANKGGAGAVVSVLEQIAGGDIAAENVFELATGKRIESIWPLRTRGEVFSWDEPAGDIARKAGYHAFRGFAPQFLVQGENLARAAGVIPQPDDGFERQVGNELASTAGFRTTKLDLPVRMASSLGGFVSRHGDSMNRIKKDMQDGVLDTNKALAVYDASYQELRTIVSDYRALGMADRDLYLLAKEKGIPKPLIARAVHGEEDPPPPALRPRDQAEATAYRAFMARFWERYSDE